MTVPIDERERNELCDLFERLGPDAPTLCEGWSTADLAAHLILREHFHRWSDERRAAEKAKGMEAMIARLRRGAPLVPWRVPRLRVLMNGTEYLIHHEDVRRANGEGPRHDRPDLDGLAWGSTSFVGRRLARSIRPYALELRRPDGVTRRIGSGEAAVLTGEPTELLLFLTGRRANAEVELSGPPDAIEATQKNQRPL